MKEFFVDISSTYPDGFEIPDGFVFSRFGLAKKDEWVLPTFYGGLPYMAPYDYSTEADLRIVLSKKPQKLYLRKSRFYPKDVPVGIEVWGAFLCENVNSNRYFNRTTKRLDSDCTSGWVGISDVEMLVVEAERAGFTIDRSECK